MSQIIEGPRPSALGPVDPGAVEPDPGRVRLPRHRRAIVVERLVGQSLLVQQVGQVELIPVIAESSKTACCDPLDGALRRGPGWNRAVPIGSRPRADFSLPTWTGSSFSVFGVSAALSWRPGRCRHAQDPATLLFQQSPQRQPGALGLGEGQDPVADVESPV